MVFLLRCLSKQAIKIHKKARSISRYHTISFRTCQVVTAPFGPVVNSSKTLRKCLGDSHMKYRVICNSSFRAGYLYSPSESDKVAQPSNVTFSVLQLQGFLSSFSVSSDKGIVLNFGTFTTVTRLLRSGIL